MSNRYADLVAGLRAAVLDGPGEVDPELRRAAAAGTGLPSPWDGYVTKVRDASYRITDGDIAALKAAGCPEEEIFEVTIAAATGAALRRLAVGLHALGVED